jgi:hypothetical protein
MAITSAQTIAVAGLVNGQGITSSQDMGSQFGTNNSKPLVVAIDNLYASGAANNVAGLSTILNKIPKWVSGRNGIEKISAQATAQASSIMGSGVSGVKNFALTVNQTGGYGSASLDWASSIEQYKGKSFTDFGLQNKSYQDIASGGITGAFSALKGEVSGIVGGLESRLPKINTGGIQNAMKDFGSSLAKLGTAFSFADMTQTFAPGSFIKNLRRQGLGDVGELNYKLAAQGIVSDEDLDKADPAVLRKTMDTVTSADVQKVVDQTGMQLPPGAKLTSLSDLLNAKKILPPNLQAMAPSGSMSDINSVLGNMGGKFKSSTDIAKFVGKSEVPDFGKLGALASPLPQSFIADLSPFIGKVPLPAVDGVIETMGTGPLGNPTVKDMMGSAAGVGFTDNFKKINAAHDSVMNSAVGQNLHSALVNVYTADQNGDPTDPSRDALAVAVDKFNQAVATSPEIVAAQKAAAGTILQMTRESGLLPLAGVDLANPPAVPGVTGILNLAKSLPSFGVDKLNLGFKDVLSGVADKTSIYGEAIQAAMMEGRNRARQTLAGISDNISADPTAILGAKLSAKQSAGLTDLQKQNVIADAKDLKIEPSQALSNTQLFGYNNDYFVKKGYPSA